MPAAKRILLVHAADRAMDQIMAGIDDVRQTGRLWTFRHQYTPVLSAREAADLLAWKPDGILSALSPTHPRLAAGGVPWVSIRHRQSPLSVVVDEEAVGASAAAHLDVAGVATLACLLATEHVDSATTWLMRRLRGFEAAAERLGRRTQVIRWDSSNAGRVAPQAILDQLAGLPRPVGLFAGNDWFALEMLEMLLSAGIRIPADVALLGADDWTRCAEAAVPLSSVQVPHRACGRRAAEMLDAAMASGAMRTELEVIGPVGVSARASTDPIGIADPHVADVVRRIASNIGEPFGVAEAIAACPLSRRTIEMRFKASLGCTILEMIHKLRIDRAKQLLGTSDVPIADIALACGISDAAHFAVVFRRITGVTPSQFRSQLAKGS